MKPIYKVLLGTQLVLATLCLATFVTILNWPQILGPDVDPKKSNTLMSLFFLAMLVFVLFLVLTFICAQFTKVQRVEPRLAPNLNHSGSTASRLIKENTYMPKPRGSYSYEA